MAADHTSLVAVDYTSSVVVAAVAEVFVVEVFADCKFVLVAGVAADKELLAVELGLLTCV